MFSVPTYLAPSAIHGTGVYAAEPIAAGTVIWDFTPGVDWELSEEELQAFPERLRDQIESWCFQREDGVYVLCGDNAKFMNHSFEPNCDDKGDVTLALRDIGAGEELTCDYRAFDMKSKENGLEEFRRAG